MCNQRLRSASSKLDGETGLYHDITQACAHQQREYTCALFKGVLSLCLLFKGVVWNTPPRRAALQGMMAALTPAALFCTQRRRNDHLCRPLTKGIVNKSRGHASCLQNIRGVALALFRSVCQDADVWTYGEGLPASN